MTTLINGNIVTLTTSIPYESLKNATKKGPVYITDEQGRKVYGVTTGNLGSISEAGTSFTHATSQGYAALNIGIAVNGEDPVEYVVDALGKEIDRLEFFEPAIIEALEHMELQREAIRNTITVM